ncbi:hypothetical protein JAAARDRAFT_528319 [Jaapia argillacea MUCL 33604]|uniref:Uncharacterized protein n=1 Tax=Jaapia argillacea MUCL 33604 TaxID=933084 RepID=A0A067QHB7_9AGAM|nr:hypothetical protein JAAARDRAFT_528319 [Jaapia argillacea MUCL 33604]
MLASANSPQVNSPQILDDVDDGDDGKRNDPAIKSIIAFSINYVATLNAQTYPELSEAEIAIAATLPPKIYVGVLDNVYGLPFDEDPFIECRIYFITQQLPPADSDLCLEPAMSIPIWPTTEHPLSREPIKLTNPLPWPNCYLSSICSDLRILASEFDDTQICASMPFPESRRVKPLRREDEKTRRNLLDARAAQQDPNSAAQCVDESNLPNAQNNEDEAQATQVDAVFKEHAGHDEVGDIMLQIMSSTDAPSKLTMVDAWYDLSLPIDLPDPRGFFEEEKAIRKLRAEGGGGGPNRCRQIAA